MLIYIPLCLFVCSYLISASTDIVYEHTNKSSLDLFVCSYSISVEFVCMLIFDISFICIFMLKSSLEMNE